MCFDVNRFYNQLLYVVFITVLVFLYCHGRERYFSIRERRAFLTQVLWTQSYCRMYKKNKLAFNGSLRFKSKLPRRPDRTCKIIFLPWSPVQTSPFQSFVLYVCGLKNYY